MLRASIGAYRRHVGIAALFLVSHQTGEALVPVLIGVVIDEAVTTGDPQALIGWPSLSRRSRCCGSRFRLAC